MRKHTIGPFMRMLALCAALGILLAACDAGSGGGSGSAEFFESGGKPVIDESYQREAPPVKLAEAGGGTVSEANGGRDGTIDTSHAADGYVAARVTAGSEAMFQVARADDPNQYYNYSLDNDGSWDFFPLSYGDGAYLFTIYIHQSGNSYEQFLVHQESVTISSEQAPFLVPNRVVDYTADSATVALGQELAQHCKDEMEVIRQVYYWVTSNIVYDTEKAANIDSYGPYVPDVDEIIRTKKGICYDYAAVAAAMLRSNGIPTQLVMGNVNSEGGAVYHAWNQVWTEESGWIAVKFQVSANSWNRVDTTFAAAGDSSISEFIGDGSNYFETSIH